MNYIVHITALSNNHKINGWIANDGGITDDLNKRTTFNGLLATLNAIRNYENKITLLAIQIEQQE